MTSFHYLVVVSVLKSKAYACIATVSPEDPATTTTTTAATGTGTGGANAAAANAAILSGRSAVPIGSFRVLPGGGILAVADSGGTAVVGTRIAGAATEIVSGGYTTAISIGSGGATLGTGITAAPPSYGGTAFASVGFPGINTTTTAITTTTYIPGSPVSDANCNSWCPTTYKDDCNNMATVCATAVQASAVVASTGTECRLTWTCPAGTAPYYYVYFPPTPQPYPTNGNYSQCFPPPNNVWYLPDGTTMINGMACQSPP